MLAASLKRNNESYRYNASNGDNNQKTKSIAQRNIQSRIQSLLSYIISSRKRQLDGGLITGGVVAEMAGVSKLNLSAIIENELKQLMGRISRVVEAIRK